LYERRCDFAHSARDARFSEVRICVPFAIPRFTRLDRSVREIRSVRYRTVCGNVRSTAGLQRQNGRFYSAGNPFFVRAGYSWFKKSV
jgi:hypothetical protein